MNAPRYWPEWFKTMVATAILGVPVVLWIAALQATASNADARSIKNADEIREVKKLLIDLDIREARIEEQLKGLREGQQEIKAQLRGR